MCGEFLKCPQAFDFSDWARVQRFVWKSFKREMKQSWRERFPEVWCLLALCFGFSARRPLLLVFYMLNIKENVFWSCSVCFCCVPYSLCVFSLFFNLLFYLLNPIHHFIKLTIQPRFISCFFLNVKILKF